MELPDFQNTDYIEAEREANNIIEEATPTTVEDFTTTTTTVDEVPIATPVSTPAPVQTPASTPAPKKDTSSKGNASSLFGGLGLGNGKFYLGIAVSDMAVRADDDANLFGEEDYQDRQTGITFVAGYDFMKYLGAELRAALSVDGENKNQDNLTEFGIYLKPKYSFPQLDNKLTVYGLLGYSSINMSDPVEGNLHHGTPSSPFDGTNGGFSYGYGLDYSVTSNISVFTDVVNYLRNFGASNSTWGANVGIKYSLI